MSSQIEMVSLESLIPQDHAYGSVGNRKETMRAKPPDKNQINLNKS